MWEEMFDKDLVDHPEYISALTQLKFKTFLYPGGSASYYYYPKGTGEFNIRPEEVAHSKNGEQRRQLLRGGVGGETADEAGRTYNEFVRTFPTRKIPVYRRDWGDDKKIYMLQWGTHADIRDVRVGQGVAEFPKEQDAHARRILNGALADRVNRRPSLRRCHVVVHPPPLAKAGTSMLSPI